MALQLTKKRSTRLTTFTGALFAVFALIVQPIVAADVPAAFASGNVTVTAENLNGWTRYGTANPGYEFVNESSPVGSGALKFETLDNNSYVQLDRTLSESSTLAADINLSYWTKWVAGPAHAAPAFVVAIDKDGDLSDLSDNFWAWYEPAYNNTGNYDYSNWNTWNITADSKFWYNGAKPAEATSYTQTLNSVLVNLPDAKVSGFTLNMGTGNGGWSALVDNVTTTEATYDFEPTPYNPDPTNSYALTLSGDVYRDIALDNCDNLGECKNQRTSDMLADWEMRLYREDESGAWSQVKTALTNADGVYSFGGQQEAGVYHVCEVLKAGWTQPVQTWTGSGYRVETLNASGVAGEGPYCTTTTYDDTKSTSSKSHFGNVDTTKPTTTVVGPGASGGFYSKDFVIQAQTTDYQSGVAKVVLNLYGESGLLRSCVNKAVDPVASLHEFNCPIDVSALGDGEYYAKVNAVDKAGLMSNTVVWKFTIDMVAPTFTIESPANGSAVKNTVTVRARIADDSGIKKVLMTVPTKSGSKTYVYEEGKVNNSLSKDGDVYSVDVDTNLMNDGKAYVVLRGTDNAGNTRYWNNNATTRQHSFIVDNADPTTTINVPTGTVGARFTVSGKAEDNRALNRVYVQLVNRENNQRYGGTTINLIGKGTEAQWKVEYNADALNLPDGNYAAHVSVVDMLGNVGSNGWTNDFTVDSTAPVVESVSLENIDGNHMTSAKMNADGKLEFRITTDEEILAWKSQAFLMRTLADGGEIVLSRINFEKVSDTTYVAYLNVDEGVLTGAYTEDMRLRFKLYDVLTNSTAWTYLTLNAAGEYDTSAGVYRFTVDNVAPDASLSVTPTQSARLGSPVMVTGSVDQEEQHIKSHWFEITAPDGSVAYVYNLNTSDKSYSFELDTSAGVGEYHIRYVATDRFGNRSDDPNYTNPTVVTVPVIAPVLPRIEAEVPVDDEETNENTGGQTQGGDTTSSSRGSLVSPLTLNGPVATGNFATTFIAQANENQTAVTEDDNDETDVLGTSTTDSKAEVAGASTTDKGWNPFSMAWYWWLVAVAGLMGAWLLVAAGIRRLRGNEA